MKVKILKYWTESTSAASEYMENDINNFIKDKEVIDIKASVGGYGVGVTGNFYDKEDGKAYFLFTILYNETKKKGL